MQHATETPWQPLQRNTERRAVELGNDCGDYLIRFAYDPTPTDPFSYPHCVDFAVYNIVGLTSDARRFYELPNFTGPGDWTEDIEAAAPTVSGFVKWDGCTQFDYPHGVHIDELDGLQKLHHAVERARHIAIVEIMKRKEYE